MDRFSSTMKMAKERIREHKGQQTPSNLKNPEKTEENKKEYQRRVHVCMYVCICVCVCVCVCSHLVVSNSL